jgi:hypothetical protein
MREVRPLRSTGIAPLPRYYEPVRLPAEAAAWLWIPTRRCVLGTSPGLPESCHLSVDARPPQSPRAARCVHMLVASAPVAGFGTFGRVTTANGFTRPCIRFACAGLAPSLSSLASDSPAASRSRTGPLRALSYPPAPDRSYMLNEQFTWLTPHSQRERCSYRRTEGTK